MGLTQKQLKTILYYNKKTGILKWLKSRQGVRPNMVAGGYNYSGYAIIKINGKYYKSHRLAWLYVYGYFPENDIDHINRIKYDNRLCNLREVSRSCNNRNSKLGKNNKTGVKGIYYYKKTKNWKAQITVNKKTFSLGTYIKKQDAVKSRWEAEKKYNFPNCQTKSSAFLYLKKHNLIEEV